MGQDAIVSVSVYLINSTKQIHLAELSSYLLSSDSERRPILLSTPTSLGCLCNLSTDNHLDIYIALYMQTDINVTKNADIRDIKVPLWLKRRPKFKDTDFRCGL